MWKKNWESSQQRYINWWNQKGLLISMWEHMPKADGIPYEPTATPRAWSTLDEKWFDPIGRAERIHHDLAHSSLLGDIPPVANTQLGPGSLAASMGARLEGRDDTIWIRHNPEQPNTIAFDPNSEGWKLHLNLLRECKKNAAGRYYVGCPDLVEGLDTLASLFGTEEILMNLILDPDTVHEQLARVNEIYRRCYDEIYQIIRQGDESAFCYFSLWAPGRCTKIQSDISTMIAEDDYRTFCLPYFREQLESIDYALYHLDGVGAIRHLDAILELERLNAIQWTPGVGEPQGGDPKWYDLYRKILAGGKSVMACWVTLDQMRPLLDTIGADGVSLLMDFRSEGDIEKAIRIAEQYGY